MAGDTFGKGKVEGVRARSYVGAYEKKEGRVIWRTSWWGGGLWGLPGFGFWLSSLWISYGLLGWWSQSDRKVWRDKF